MEYRDFPLDQWGLRAAALARCPACIARGCRAPRRDGSGSGAAGALVERREGGPEQPSRREEPWIGSEPSGGGGSSTTQRCGDHKVEELAWREEVVEAPDLATGGHPEAFASNEQSHRPIKEPFVQLDLRLVGCVGSEQQQAIGAVRGEGQ